MRKTLVQFLRYVVVGLLSNAVLFSLYLAFTEAGLSSKISMTLLYLMGVLQTFYFNKRWTFVRRGWSGVEVFRYGMVYGLGYLTNFDRLACFCGFIWAAASNGSGVDDCFGFHRGFFNPEILGFFCLGSFSLNQAEDLWMMQAR